MPHSPRWYRNRLWLLDAGTGYFGHLDMATGKFERVTFCPGFARGLAFAGNYAVVGISLPRHDPTFQDLAAAGKSGSRKSLRPLWSAGHRS